AMKLVGTEGSFRGTVDKLFEERDGDLIVFDFDPNYRTALTAVLRNPDFPKFPVVRDLKGKEIVVSGKFVDYHGKAQIELTDPKQIKLANYFAFCFKKHPPRAGRSATNLYSLLGMGAGLSDNRLDCGNGARCGGRRHSGRDDHSPQPHHEPDKE